MELQKLSSKLITQICEKNYANAYSTLEFLVAEKIKSKIKKIKKDLDKPKSKKTCDCGCDECEHKK
jgi:hypothetical protein